MTAAARQTSPVPENARAGGSRAQERSGDDEGLDGPFHEHRHEKSQEPWYSPRIVLLVGEHALDAAIVVTVPSLDPVLELETERVRMDTQREPALPPFPE